MWCISEVVGTCTFYVVALKFCCRLSLFSLYSHLVIVSVVVASIFM